MRATAVGSPTSAMMPATLPPSASISPTTASTCSRLAWPLTMTFAPSRAIMQAIARPMFCPDPVTSAVLQQRTRKAIRLRQFSSE